MSKYLVTGANGFVAQALCRKLIGDRAAICGSVRHEGKSGIVPGVEAFVTGDIDKFTDWQPALRDVDVVFHLAATVHRPDIQDPLIYHASIVDGTEALATQAIKAGVKRFVYLSTSHVYGVEASDEAIKELHTKKPSAPYGQAKLMAENELLALVGQSTMEIVIIRPPLVYGNGVKGNLASLVKLVGTLPILPLGSATKKRSFIGLGNLISFLQLCAENKNAANKIFNISDDFDISTAELCKILSKLMHKKICLLSLPNTFIRPLCGILGKKSLYNKLFESVRLDIGNAKTLGWVPPYSVRDQLELIFKN